MSTASFIPLQSSRRCHTAHVPRLRRLLLQRRVSRAAYPSFPFFIREPPEYCPSWPPILSFFWLGGFSLASGTTLFFFLSFDPLLQQNCGSDSDQIMLNGNVPFVPPLDSHFFLIALVFPLGFTGFMHLHGRISGVSCHTIAGLTVRNRLLLQWPRFPVQLLGLAPFPPFRE